MKKFITLLLLFLPVSVFAHAFPIAYEPDGFSSSPTMPSEVVIHFSQGISSDGNGIEIFAPDGTKLPDAIAVVGAQSERTLSRSLVGAGEGIYVVSWHGVSSDDGHFTKGAFSFFVGATSSAPEFYGGSAGTEVGVAHGTPMSSLGLDMNGHAITMFLIFLVLSILIGSSVFLSFLHREKGLNDQTRAQFVLRTRPIAYLSSLILFIGVAAIVTSPEQFSFARPSGLRSVTSLLFDGIAVTALLIWVGSMLIFAVAYFPLLASQSVLLPSRMPLRAMLGRMFAWTLLLGGSGGALVVWMHLKSWNNLTTTAWGSTLITVLLFSGLMLLLRSLSLFFLERVKRCVHCEWAYALLESGVSMCVLFLVVVAMMIPSPVYNSALWSVMRMDASRMITVTDLGEKENTLRLRAYDAMGVPIAASLPTVLLDNKKEGIGPLFIPVKDRGEGNYDMPWVLFTPEGEWRVAITFKQQGAYDINATIGIDYPREIHASRQYAETPRFGAFEAALCVSVLIILTLAFLMLRFIERNNAFALLHPEYDTDAATIGKGKAIIIAVVAFLSAIMLIVMLRIMLPFYSESVHDGTIMPLQTGNMRHDMSAMEMGS
jgi:methionine-rich copper-binding protein CopC